MSTVIHPARPAAPPAASALRLIVVFTVWVMCATAVVLTGCLDGSVIGTLAMLLVAFDATIFTKGYLQ